MEQDERAVAHLKSALRYERHGLHKKARAHFGRAMHYGGSLAELPADVMMMIITRALDGEDAGGLLHALLATDTGTSVATLETIVASVRRFPEQPADEIVTSPFYRFYLYTLRAVARKPTIELVKLLVEYKRSGGADPRLADPQVALKEIRILIISKWYLTSPYRFHDIAGIRNDAKSDEETKGVCGTMIDDFIDHLKNSADHTVLRRPEILRKILEIKEGSFKPGEITDANIRELVMKYETQEVDSVADATYGPLCLWKTGRVTSMSFLFFNVKWKDSEWDLRLWDTRRVTAMSAAFENCKGTMVGVEHWNVMAVKEMDGIFSRASMFNRDISTWDTSQVENMGSAFYMAELFNQPIGNWDTSQVKKMSLMFTDARAFNQPVGKWKTGNVTYMNWMFRNARAFNRDISSWNMSNVTNTEEMFHGAIEMEDENKPRGSNAQTLA
jgi:surface protein